MTVAVPTATPVKATEQVPDTKVQLAATVPTVVFEDTKVTVPVGVFEGVVVSVTVATQDEVAPIAILFGLQSTPVKVPSVPTAMLNGALVLAL